MTTLNRRTFLDRISTAAQSTLLGGMLIGAPGCVPSGNGEREPNLVWGRFGHSDGRFQKPRAMVMSPKNELYIVDKSARIQVFDPNDRELERHRGDKLPEGKFLRGWQTPIWKQGKPTGLGWGNDDVLLVADTHYYRVLFYSPEGVLDEARTIGGEFGDDPGQFHFLTDVVQDTRGHYFVGQYGQIDQIQEFSPDGGFIRRWGTQGRNLGEFARPQCLIMDNEGLLWIADASNHRVQVFDVSSKTGTPKLVLHWGEEGSLPGQLKYPYGLVFDADGSVLVSEFGNHRVQRFSRDGKSLECWGGPGRDSGQFKDPWALIVDSQQNLHVLDTGNNRVQRYSLS